MKNYLKAFDTNSLWCSNSLGVIDKKVYLARLSVNSNSFICADDINLYCHTKLGNLSVVNNALEKK